MSSDPAPQHYAVFAKRIAGEKLIIVAFDDDVFATLFRARAVPATLTLRV